MTTIAIELIDDGIVAVGTDGSEVEPSPGYALLDGRRLVVGSKARAESRLKPRWVDNRFWDRLDSEPMPRPFPRGLSRADVAHAHLSEVWTILNQRQTDSTVPSSVLLVVPGSFSTEQLGLVLGIARAGDVPVSGLVDAAVAAASGTPVTARVLHLDLLLHRAVWTELEHDGELARRRVEVLEGSGLIAFRNLWARHIAETMVRQTRFDPLHHGVAEQALFDSLPLWMTKLTHDGRVEIGLASGDKVHNVEIAGDVVGQVAGPALEPILEVGRAMASEGALSRLMVSDRAGQIPGLVAALARFPNRGLETLQAAAAAAGALSHRDRIESSDAGLRLVTRLPAELDERQPPPEASDPESDDGEPLASNSPTHVLLASAAYALGSEPLWLGSAPPEEGRGLVVAESMPGLSRRHCALVRRRGEIVVEDHSSYGTFVNDRRIERRTAVRVGDRLRLGSPGVELSFIVVENDV